jgi:hypothetical protein
LFAGNHIARACQQLRENQERLTREADEKATPAQFAGCDIDLKGSEGQPIRGLGLEHKVHEKALAEILPLAYKSMTPARKCRSLSVLADEENFHPQIIVRAWSRGTLFV